MTDYSDYPVSLGETKSEKNRDGSLWTPRDCLIDLLRRIDSKQANPSVIFVACGVVEVNENGGQTTITSFSSSAPNSYLAMGCVHRAIQMYNDCK